MESSCSCLRNRSTKLRNQPLKEVSSNSRAYSPKSHKKKILDLDTTKPQKLEKTLETLPKSRKTKRKELKREIKKKEEGKGSSTRGWSAVSPQKGKERNELMNKCGEGCFLDPKNKGYPICPALRTDQGCKIDCRALTAAINRSAEWDASSIRKLAEKIRKKKCK